MTERTEFECDVCHKKIVVSTYIERPEHWYNVTFGTLSLTSVEGIPIVMHLCGKPCLAKHLKAVLAVANRAPFPTSRMFPSPGYIGPPRDSAKDWGVWAFAANGGSGWMLQDGELRWEGTETDARKLAAECSNAASPCEARRIP